MLLLNNLIIISIIISILIISIIIISIFSHTNNSKVRYKYNVFGIPTVSV